MFFQIMLFSESTHCGLDDVYIERWLVSWSWWHQTRYCPMCEAQHGSIVPPTTPHPQLCRDANSQCSASTLNQPQYQMQCKPVLFNFWYSNILQMRRRQWAQCETVSFTINYFRYIHQLQHLLAMLWGNVGLGLDTNSGITKPMKWNILQIRDFWEDYRIPTPSFPSCDLLRHRLFQFN